MQTHTTPSATPAEALRRSVCYLAGLRLKDRNSSLISYGDIIQAAREMELYQALLGSMSPDQLVCCHLDALLIPLLGCVMTSSAGCFSVGRRAKGYILTIRP